MKWYDPWVCFESRVLNSLSQNHNLECFSSISLHKRFICEESFYDFSQFRFDGKGGMFISKHKYDFLIFFKPHEIYDEEVVCIFFTLTIEGQVSLWYHTSRTYSIHSFFQFLNKVHQAFDRYGYQDVYDRSDQFRMKYSEYLENFLDQFLHFWYEFLTKYFNYKLITENF